MKCLFYSALIVLTCSFLNACAPIIVAGTVAGAGVTVASDRRSADKIIEDEAIEIQASDYIYSHPVFGKEVHVSATSFNGTVLLVGETLDKKSKQDILNKVNRMRGVKKIIDAINIKRLASATDRSHDTWTTTKVKSHIIAKKGLLTRSKVVTSDSHVYLMGIVSNKEAKKIIQIVKGVSGVASVTPLFESKDGTLDHSLSAAAHTSLTTPIKQPKTEAKPQTDDEDNFTVQNYVIQPAIKINTQE